MSMVPAIELRGISKRFGSILANDKVDLKVNRGEILAILGENGSGKTTLMNMISGIYFPDEGEILIDGNEYTNDQEGISIVVFDTEQGRAVDSVTWNTDYGMRGQRSYIER